MIRDDQQRATLFDVDVAIQRLAADMPGHPSLVHFTGVYRNLPRKWSDM